jgi:hypothetical protein
MISKSRRRPVAADAFAFLALTLDSSAAGDSFSRKISYPKAWIA